MRPILPLRYAMHRPLLSVVLTFLALTTVGACGGDAGRALGVEQEALPSPAGPASGEPFVSEADGRVYLSWLQAASGDGHELRFARFDGEAWSDPKTIARSDRFFVNWADFPSLTPGPDGTLWAHWLERGAEGGYDYGIRIVRSEDGGETWSEPMTPHEDDSATEHGFVSALAFEDGVGFVWLDGREYAAGIEGSVPPQEMTLRYRFVGTDGAVASERLIDGRVCDCCQTAAAMTDAGPVAVYRNRSDAEVRDVYVSRLRDGAWTEGVPVHEDGWTIAGCPVNGPQVVARGMDVAVAWFTAVGDAPRVKVAFSHDGGAAFGEPTVVDGGNPEGRVDLIMREDRSVLVSWLERTGGENAEVRLRRVAPDGTMSGSLALVGSSAGRASGFPRLVARGPGEALLAWTDLDGDAPRVRVTRLRLEDGDR